MSDLVKIRLDNRGVEIKSNRDWREEAESLRKRVKELEADGHKIERMPVEGTNRYGNPCRVTRYRLLKDE